jgi:hypothetical protein
MVNLRWVFGPAERRALAEDDRARGCGEAAAGALRHDAASSAAVPASLACWPRNPTRLHRQPSAPATLTVGLRPVLASDAARTGALTGSRRRYTVPHHTAMVGNHITRVSNPAGDNS